MIAIKLKTLIESKSVQATASFNVILDYLVLQKNENGADERLKDEGVSVL